MGQQVAFIPGFTEQVVAELVAKQPAFIDITTPSTVAEELEIRHDLQRIPNGYAIVKRPYVTFFHGHDSTDTVWTDEFIYAKFSATDLELTLAVF